jgi:beta-N-acetylhexosaminidase
MKLRIIGVLCAWLTISVTSKLQAQSFHDSWKNALAKKWVDSTYNSLNVDERIGQLFMVAAYSGGKNYNEEAITNLVKNRQIGGLIFMQGGPGRQAVLTNKYQQLAQVPLMIAMDAEWGLGMRLDSVENFPRQMMIGATRDTALMYQIGMAIAYQSKRLGVHVNFAPDVDINNNANNPVINSRSFGENKYWVTALGKAYMNGLQDNGVLACLKHFPGHGNTDVDSHKDLPIIKQSKDALHNTELFPFKQLIHDGAQSMMIAHLEVPALEPQQKLPSTLSYNIVTDLLKRELGFKGLIFTDALNMDGVAKYYEPGDVDLKAFLAGNDVLLFSQNVPIAISKIKGAISNGQITTEELEHRVKKILYAKYKYNVHKRSLVEVNEIQKDVNQFTEVLKEKTSAAAATLVKDENNILSKLAQSNVKIQYLAVNTSNTEALETSLKNKFSNLTTTKLPKDISTDKLYQAQKSLENFDVNIVVLHNVSFYPGKNYGISNELLTFLKKIQKHPNTMVVVLGNVYALKNLCEVKSALVFYEEYPAVYPIVTQVLKGEIKANGEIPVSVCNTMPVNNQIITPAVTPKKINSNSGSIDSNAIQKLNGFINKCIQDRVFPGAQIVALKHGDVVLNQSYGTLVYQKKNTVTNTTLYDIASITKIASTTLAVMKLYDERKIDLDKKLSDYLSWTKGTDKANITIKNLLLHQAGLKSWIPFYKETIDSVTKQPSLALYQPRIGDQFKVKVADKMFLRNDFEDTLWSRILTQPLETVGKYTYSDLDFYFLQKVVERITKESLDEYMERVFYKPMHLNSITYNAWKNKDLSTIAPTEQDMTFRQQLIKGYVHDQGAALQGGVAGHAGLFANAMDVAQLMYMLMNKGKYNGVQYLSPATVTLFTKYNAKHSRRGLGFDKPNNSRVDAGPTSDRCSGFTFGHQGFTGTCAWADPENGIVFVMLTNRVYPSAENNAINRTSARTVAQDYIYEALRIPVNKNRAEIHLSQTK